METLTTQQAAEILQIKQVSVVRAIQRGHLKAHKFGSVWAIDKAEVLRYAEQRRVKPKPK